MSAEIERLRGKIEALEMKIEALEIMTIAALAKSASDNIGARMDTIETVQNLKEFGVPGLSPVALSGFREVLSKVLRSLDTKRLE